MNEAAVTQRSLGPITLAPGVKRRQILFFLAVVLPAGWTSGFFSLMQPLIIDQQLGVPSGQQGMVAGLLGSTHQAAFLMFILMAGSFADHFGRRSALIVALLGFAFCAVLYPFVGVVWLLFVVRFLQGAFQTGWTAGGATKIMDYPDNKSRGKFVSLMLICQTGSAAIVVSLITSRMPSWFRDAGFSAVDATRYSFFIISLVALAGAASAFFLLDKDSHRHLAAKQAGGEAASSPAQAKRNSLAQTFSNMGDVFAHARKNPKFAVILLIGAVIRTDSVIMGTFLGLWIVNAAKVQGLDAIEATKTIGTIGAIMSAAGFITPPLFGFVADKVNRFNMLIISLGMTAVGFCAVGMVDDVFGKAMIAVVIMIGLAEGAQTVSAQSLFAEEAPPHIRGSAMGIFAFLGTGSVLVINLIGGYLFDKAGFTAPFVMEGLLNLLFLIIALVMVRGHRRKEAISRASEARNAAKIVGE